MSEGAKVLAFPARKPASEGALVGPGSRRVPCPVCKASLQPFRAHWHSTKFYQNSWLCSDCGGTFGPPSAPPELGAIDLATGGKLGDKVALLGPLAQNAKPFSYEMWVTEDGLIRVTDGAEKHRNKAFAVAITAEQAERIGHDFRALAQAAVEQRERLRGDDRWHVRPHPERPMIFIVRKHLHFSKYTERVFCQCVIRKARTCDICRAGIKTDVAMWREESPVKWAVPNWRDVRICSPCILGRTP